MAAAARGAVSNDIADDIEALRSELRAEIERIRDERSLMADNAVKALHKRVIELEHQLAQAAETERVLRAHRAPLRRIAELEAQLERLTTAHPDRLAMDLQAELITKSRALADLTRRAQEQAKHIKALEKLRVQAAEREREARDKLQARVGELEGQLDRLRARGHE